MATRNAASMGDYGSSWQANGYAGNGNVHELIGSLKGRVAIVCGGSDKVFTDLAEVLASVPQDSDNPHVIFAANDVGMFLPHVDHWVSLHGRNLAVWKPVRWLHPKERETTKYHSIEQYGMIDYVWEGLTPMFWLSGYFAMQIAYIMDADRIILCGCPGDGSKRFFDLYSPKHFFYGRGEGGADKNTDNMLVNEMTRLPDFKKRVRSMSGWTKTYFGGLD